MNHGLIPPLSARGQSWVVELLFPPTNDLPCKDSRGFPRVYEPALTKDVYTLRSLKTVEKIEIEGGSDKKRWNGRKKRWNHKNLSSSVGKPSADSAVIGLRRARGLRGEHVSTGTKVYWYSGFCLVWEPRETETSRQWRLPTITMVVWRSGQDGSGRGSFWCLISLEDHFLSTRPLFALSLWN